MLTFFIGLRPGDSGSWVVSERTGSVYGHVVSIDAFGEGQVMPISLTLESIRMQLDAVRVWLPTPEDVRTAAGSRQGFPIAQSSETPFTSKYIEDGISPPSPSTLVAPRTAQSMAQPDQWAEHSSHVSFAPQAQSPTLWNRVAERIHRNWGFFTFSTPSKPQPQSASSSRRKRPTVGQYVGHRYGRTFVGQQQRQLPKPGANVSGRIHNETYSRYSGI